MSIISGINGNLKFSTQYSTDLQRESSINESNETGEELTSLLQTNQVQDEESYIEEDTETKAVNSSGTSKSTSATAKKVENTHSLTASEKEQIEARIKELEEKKEKNNEKIEKYQELINEEKNNIDTLTEEAENLSKENQKAAQNASEAVVKEYKEGRITREQLKSVIKERITEAIDVDGLEQLESQISAGSANITSYKSAAAEISSENEDIEDELESLYDKIEQADTVVNAQVSTSKTSETQTASSESQTTDDDTTTDEDTSSQTEPQGFQIKNADGSITQYDFFVDRDGNKNLSDENEFLGAKADAAGNDGWDEMQVYDFDNDGKITYKEFQQGNSQKINGGDLMVMVTTIDGDGTKTQKAQTLDEAFGKDSDITIDAEKNEYIDKNVGPYNFNDSQYNNDMLGNFNVRFNGQNVVGYQTDDDISYLKDYYKFTNRSVATSASNSNTTNNVKSINSNLSEINTGNMFNGYIINNQATFQGTENLKSIMNDLYNSVNSISQSAVSKAEKENIKSCETNGSGSNSNGEHRDNNRKKQNFCLS